MEALWRFVGTFNFVAGAVSGLLLLGVWWLIRQWRLGYTLRTVSLSLPFGLGSVTYDISDAERVAAWQLYVQLKTRKAALPFDMNDDLVVEVLDSLYELVIITRELLLGLPVRTSESHALSDMMLRVLNDGLRPYLTKWQADFRRWWEFEVQNPAHRDQRPQTVQKAYPHFDQLIQEMMEMNQHLDEYANDLLAVVRSKRRVGIPRKRPRPIPPSSSG